VDGRDRYAEGLEKKLCGRSLIFGFRGGIDPWKKAHAHLRRDFKKEKKEREGLNLGVSQELRLQPGRGRHLFGEFWKEKTVKTERGKGKKPGREGKVLHDEKKKKSIWV